MTNPEQIPLIGPIFRATTPSEMEAVPILGETIGTFNAITDFVEYGCFPNWTVWVTTLYPALGEMILNLFSFGYGDVLRGYFRPSNVRGLGGITRKPARGKPGKIGKSGRVRRYVAIPEVGNNIGKKLPGSKFFQARKVTGKERWFWTVDFTVQRVFWYWLVADITEDFITNWTTGIMESEACRDTNGTSWTATNNGVHQSTPGDWTVIPGWTVTSGDPDGLFQVGTGNITIPFGKTLKATLAGRTFAIFPNLNEGNQLRIGSINEDFPDNETTPWPVPGTDSPFETAVLGTFSGGTFVQLLVKPIGTGLQRATDFSMTAHIS